MNEQLETAVAELITTTLQTAETAKNFIVAETPEVIQQVLHWHFTCSLIWFLVGVSILFGLAGTWIYIWKKVDTKYWEEEWFFSVILSGVFLIVGFVTTCDSFDWIKIWIAPKVWLIEYAANLVR